MNVPAVPTIKALNRITLRNFLFIIDNACRIKDAEPAVRDARLTLCLAAKQTIENVLKLIGVDAPESM